MQNGPLDIISRIGLEGIGLYYSIYPGRVVGYKDITENNSILVQILWPGLMFDNENIVVSADPFNQGGAEGDGIKYLAPAIGDSVLVTFQNGDPNKALYIRQTWPRGKAPEELYGPNKAGFVTPKGNKVVIDEDEGSLEIEFDGPIYIKSNTSVTIESPHNSFQSNITRLGNREHPEPGISTSELTSRLNTLVQEIESLKAQINAHTHNSAQGLTTPPTVPLSTNITPFVNEDYSNPDQLI